MTGVAIPTAIFWKTLALGAGYIAVYTALAAAVFHQKEL